MVGLRAKRVAGDGEAWVRAGLAVAVSAAEVFAGRLQGAWAQRYTEFNFGGTRMSSVKWGKWRVGAFLVLDVSLATLNSCNKTEKPLTGEAGQRTFASPADAGAAFLEAAKAGDQAALLAIFGPDGRRRYFPVMR